MSALKGAVDRMRLGDPAGAQSLLAPLLAREPKNPEALRLLAMSYRMLGAAARAEEAFRAAIAADKKNPACHAEYAAFLESLGRVKEAERAFRAALAVNRRYAPAAAGLSLLLLDQGRATEALQATTPLAADPKAGFGLRATHARAQHESGRLDDAETTLRNLLAEDPRQPQVHLDLAELVWMRTGEADAALAAIDEAIAKLPGLPLMRIIKARVLTQIGRGADAPAQIDEALKAAPDEPSLLAARARLSGAEGLAFAEKALAANPDDTDMLALAAQAAIAAGKAEQADQWAARLVARNPQHQFFLALQATAWRMLDDPRYGELYDYARTVNVTELATPKGWPNLTAYLADLAGGLNGMHKLRAHPFGQSVRGGSQVNILTAKHPAVAAIHAALEPPVRQTLEKIAASGHPLAGRNTGAWRYTGMWSVRLRSSGYHDNHVHPAGWLSSACYVELPKLTGEEGFLKFGEPGLRLATPLPAEKLVEPKPGRLVLFPSYMWHGTVPFTSEPARLTFAFDLVPA